MTEKLKYLAFCDGKGNTTIYGWVTEEEYDRLVEKEVESNQCLSGEGTYEGFRLTTQEEIERKWDALTF